MVHRRRLLHLEHVEWEETCSHERQVQQWATNYEKISKASSRLPDWRLISWFHRGERQSELSSWRSANKTIFVCYGDKTTETPLVRPVNPPKHLFWVISVIVAEGSAAGICFQAQMSSGPTAAAGEGGGWGEGPHIGLETCLKPHWAFLFDWVCVCVSVCVCRVADYHAKKQCVQTAFGGLSQCGVWNVAPETEKERWRERSHEFKQTLPF